MELEPTLDTAVSRSMVKCVNEIRALNHSAMGAASSEYGTNLVLLFNHGVIFI